MSESPRTWIDLVLANAEKLRSAGVQAISIDGCSVQLAPATPTPDPKPQEPPRDPDIEDPLYDPWTYGGTVPGQERPTRNDGEG